MSDDGTAARRLIHVPQMEQPTDKLCFASPSLDDAINPMLHCDRRAGHTGDHSWAMQRAIDELRDARRVAPLDPPRLMWLADRVQRQHSWIWPDPNNEYDHKHDRATCTDEDHFGCHIVAIVEAVRKIVGEAQRIAAPLDQT